MSDKSTKSQGNKLNLNEQSAAMLIIFKRGEEPTVYRMNTSVKLRTDGTVVPYKSVKSSSEDVAGEIRQDNFTYMYKDVLSVGNAHYNGKAFGSEELDNLDRMNLKEGDIISLHDEDGEIQVAFIYHRVYKDDYEWHEMDFSKKDASYIICRREESLTGDEVYMSEMDEKDRPARYAELYKSRGACFVRDNNTLMGVYINNQKVTRARRLKEMDIVRIGNTFFLVTKGRILYNHRAMVGNELSINIQKRTANSLFRRKLLLEDISLKVFPGELVLILGGSGVGKTTFINAVMGYEKAKGVITSGSTNIYREYNDVKFQIGFVPQNDLLRKDDSVFQTVYNAAQIRMPADTPHDAMNMRTHEVLDMFGLSSESESMVGKLSGGQKKRLSIAMEYIVDPRLFILDEPDSGLDGVMARSLMNKLRAIADQGKVVLVITHSPDRVSDLFDKVIVLGKDSKTGAGRLAFYGDIDEAKNFFEVPTLEAVVKRLNRTSEGGEGLADKYIAKYSELRSVREGVKK